MTSKEFKQLIIESKYYTKYEPILEKNSLAIFAYEALSKFDINNDTISTEEIFRKLHHNNKLFFELEKRNKQLQIENYDFRHKLFVNFDADIVVTDDQKKYWEKFLIEYKDKLVVEITENGSDDETSATIMKDFSTWLVDKNIDAALDDFAQDGSMFSFFIMNKCKYIKIDKSFIQQIRKNKNYLPYLEGILRTIRLNKQKSIIEGIETKEDLELVQNLNCDYIQGYYFNDYVRIV
ncbi:EAL domain-containing protein [Poseidonibacter lekithochrous]|uniref:EAL domain-containing protein n=1 Tax=Poseidonibacter lekithochrous TaxID=1904463 RepID=UPI0008FC8DC6|nr:EAL domain-containing protein [Poseidonibacter lekithochrous]QKJ24139.1 diguanylate phosphodiesterase [Poseidonibacter lekithochrous]